MCLIVDANILASFFDPDSTGHSEYRPARDWVIEGKGKLVVGGSKYGSEIPFKYLKLFGALEKVNKVVVLEKDDVDEVEARVRALEPSKDFDDPHLIAIVIVSGCRIICTNDKRAIPFLKRTELYLGLTQRPQLYTSKRNDRLLVDQRIVGRCRPCHKLNRAQRAMLPA